MAQKKSNGGQSDSMAGRTAATTKKTPARPRKSKPSAAQPVQLPHEAVARRAYEIWQEAVRRAGQPSHHWMEAETQLRAELKKSIRARRPARSRVAAVEPQKALTAGGAASEKSDTRLAA